MLGLKGAGFDYLFNSAKWWDFRAPWLLEQYDLYRQVAPTIAFPESHDTERLAIELGDPEPPELERHYRLRYLFAATFSSGVLMPMGYEYGCRTPPGRGREPARRLGVGDRAAADRPHRLHRRGQPDAGGLPGAQRRGPAAARSPRRTARWSGCCASRAATCRRPTTRRSSWSTRIRRGAWGVDPGPLLGQVGGRISAFEDVTPEARPVPFEPGQPITLEPLQLRVFRGQVEAPAPGAGARRQGRRPGEREAPAGARRQPAS